MSSSANPKPSIAITTAAFTLTLVLALSAASAQQLNRPELERLSRQYRQQLEAKQGTAYLRLLQSPDPAQRTLNEDESLQLMFVRPTGMPAFFHLHNLNAAKTVRTWDVWPGAVGGGAYSADGSATAAGELAVWDGGGVRTTHQEFGGRVTQMDSPSGIIQHATHVAGTMIAAGVNGLARGMSYTAPLHAYDWFFDTAEMAAAAANGLQVSNHSYGYASGWEPSGNWYWYGDMSVNATEDYGFGFYDDSAREYDEIMYNAPQYLICLSAGNDRNDAGPTPGGSHYHWNGSNWVLSTDTHGTDYQNGGYDTVSWTGNAKNVLLVGAVNDIAAGYSIPGNVVQTTFSSWGPTDDGRIKPDLVANGASLTSCTSTADNTYVAMSGTSMSSPSAAGSVNLIAQEFEIVRGTTPWSSTVKAIAICAADEAGLFDGPDFQNGWGLLNTKRSLDIVHAGSTDNLGVIEATLASGTSDDYYFVATTPDDIRVTIVWTDPPGTVSAPALDNPASKLVNDLDLLLVDTVGGTTTEPWTLSLALPGNAATRGPNHVDNVEQIDLANAPLGVYRVTVSHTGGLTSGSQDYSLVYRGMHYAATPVLGASRAPSFWIGEPRPNPVTGTATIDFGTRQTDVVSIHVYDVAGHRVATLVENSSDGAGTVTFDGSRLASGVYFVRMESAAQTTTRKITVVK
ncbi:MAG: S8 family peptidase [Candidatus Krumholzibacteria bacterium]|nr:S8 family peptidase [Candidatus Krumholzibacteria bacterium]MDH4336751.1 S8 family peptidase [Candidatus Krumholzibacteria bacterium]MDH5270474.1 S8 family peptidase [Candidatus Krumholzibacteria bacterium]